MTFKISAVTGTLIVAGSASLYGILLVLIEREIIEPERLGLFPPLVVLWISVCLFLGIYKYRKGRSTNR